MSKSGVLRHLVRLSHKSVSVRNIFRDEHKAFRAVVQSRFDEVVRGVFRAVVFVGALRGCEVFVALLPVPDVEEVLLDWAVRVADVVGDDAARTLEPNEAEDSAIGQGAGRDALWLGA